MIKGCQKRAVVIKGSPQSAFESAYFIMKREHDGENESEIIYQANRLISEHTINSKRKISRRATLLLVAIFALGVVTGVALGLVLSILFY